MLICCCGETLSVALSCVGARQLLIMRSLRTGAECRRVESVDVTHGKHHADNLLELAPFKIFW